MDDGVVQRREIALSYVYKDVSPRTCALHNTQFIFRSFILLPLPKALRLDGMDADKVAWDIGMESRTTSSGMENGIDGSM